MHGITTVHCSLSHNSPITPIIWLLSLPLSCLITWGTAHLAALPCLKVVSLDLVYANYTVICTVLCASF